MEQDDVLERILSIAEQDEPDQLLETTVASVDEQLYDRAAEEFGGWDAALAAALCRAASRTGDSAGSGTGRAAGRDETERISRTVGPDAKHPIFVLTDRNLFLKIKPGTELSVTDSPEPFVLPSDGGSLTSLHHVGDPEGLVLFTDAGHYFAFSPRMVPKWKGQQGGRDIARILDLEADEKLVDVVPRRAFYGGRIVHVTEGAKGKASEAGEFDYALDHEPRVAYKLNDGDHPAAVMSVPEGTGIFAASAQGRGIHFPDDELRSMGQRAVGVNVMDLDGDDDLVVGAFPAERVEQVAVVTEHGLGKRVDFGEFRQQGRAGAGMQLASLNRGDRIAAVAPCRPSDDLAVATSDGRLHRCPAGDFPAMGRPAKGNAVVDLEADASIVEFCRLPCGSE